MLRLNLGPGDVVLDGYVEHDARDGRDAFPLSMYEDGTVDEIRASHILEHYQRSHVPYVLAEWARVLKLGGVLKVAVPNFDWVCQQQAEGKGSSRLLEAYVLGGQVSKHDYHKSAFTSEQLRQELQAAGFTSIEPWESDADDCSALPVSLNLQGTKGEPVEQPRCNVIAMMSCARIGFVDAYAYAEQACHEAGINLARWHTAFWHQGMETGFDKCLAQQADLVVTIDGDSVFLPQDLRYMLAIMQAHPEVHALNAVQLHREFGAQLVSMRDENGECLDDVPLWTFDQQLTQVDTAHFGLTIIRPQRLLHMSRPWFECLTATDGSYDADKGRIDADVNFWLKWRKAGNTLYQANRVRLGHRVERILWPTRTFGSVYQTLGEFEDHGKPLEVR